MDARHFDALVRAVSAGSSRRRLLALLATLPFLSGLAAIQDSADVAGQGRRRRRKKSHKHGDRRRRSHQKKQCQAEPVAQTCAGKCGRVANNCQKTVDCGACTCVPITACPAEMECGTTSDGCGGVVECPGVCANPAPICVENRCAPCENLSLIHI